MAFAYRTTEINSPYSNINSKKKPLINEYMIEEPILDKKMDSMKKEDTSDVIIEKEVL